MVKGRVSINILCILCSLKHSEYFLLAGQAADLSLSDNND